MYFLDFLTNKQIQNAAVRIKYHRDRHVGNCIGQKCVDIFCVCIKVIVVIGLTGLNFDADY